MLIKSASPSQLEGHSIRLCVGRSLGLLENSHLVLKIHEVTKDTVEREGKEMALSKSRQTRRELSLEDNCRLIREKDSRGKSCREQAKIFSIGKSQVSQIMKKKGRVPKGVRGNAPADRK